MQAVIVAQDNDLNDYLAYMLRRSGFEVNFRASLHALIKDWNERPADLQLRRRLPIRRLANSGRSALFIS
jgi:DNA-binding response OmpR family regulator